MSNSTVVRTEAGKAVRGKATKQLAAALGLTIAAMAASQPVAASTCPTYGCEVEIIPIGDDNYVIHAVGVFPTTWYNKAPSGNATYTVNGGSEEMVAITWDTHAYRCCCPDEWNGEFAAVLGPAQLRVPLNPNDVVEVSFGTAERCTAIVPMNLKPEGGAGLMSRTR